MEKLEDTNTLPHVGVQQKVRMHLRAVPPFPRLGATQAAAPKQALAAEPSSSERATCKLPPLQAAASASSAGGRAKASGTKAHSHRELLPPLPCISGERDKAVRAESWARGPHSPVAPDDNMDYAVKSFVSTVIRNARACKEGAKSKARLSPSGRVSKGHLSPPLSTAVPENWMKKSQHSSKHSPAAPAQDTEDAVKAIVSTAISNAVAWEEAAMREARLSPLGTGPRDKGRRTPPLHKAVPQNVSKCRHPAPHSPTDSSTALWDTAQSVVSAVVAKAIAESWEHGQRPTALGDLAHTGCQVTPTRSVEVQTDTDSRWTTALPGRHPQARARTTAAGRAPAPASPDRGVKQGQEGQLNLKASEGSGKEGTSQGWGKKQRGPVGGHEEEEIIIFNSWVNPRFPSLFQDPQEFPQEVGSSSSTVDTEAAAQESEPPTSTSLGSSDTDPSAASLAEGPGDECRGTPLTTAPAESRPTSPPSAPACEDEGSTGPSPTPLSEESKPSDPPIAREHSTMAMAERQGHAQHASSACDEELYETARIIVSAVLRQAVAVIQGATSKAPPAPSATGPRVPPPPAEPVERTSSASALAGSPVGEAKDSTSTAAAAMPQEGEVASTWAGDPAGEANDNPLAQAAAAEEEEVAQGTARQPRPSRLRRALQALCRPFC